MPRVFWFVPVLLILFLLAQPMFGGAKGSGYGKTWCGWPASEMYRVKVEDGSSTPEIIDNLAERFNAPSWGIRGCNFIPPWSQGLYPGAWIAIPNPIGLYIILAWIAVSLFIIVMAWLTRDR